MVAATYLQNTETQEDLKKEETFALNLCSAYFLSKNEGVLYSFKTAETFMIAEAVLILSGIDCTIKSHVINLNFRDLKYQLAIFFKKNTETTKISKEKITYHENILKKYGVNLKIVSIFQQHLRSRNKRINDSSFIKLYYSLEKEYFLGSIVIKRYRGEPTTSYDIKLERYLKQVGEKPNKRDIDIMRNYDLILKNRPRFGTSIAEKVFWVVIFSLASIIFIILNLN